MMLSEQGSALNEYLGYKPLLLTDEDLSEVYSGGGLFGVPFNTNEYLLALSVDGSASPIFRWTGERFDAVHFRTASSKLCGKVKPRNPQQVMAMDLLYDDSVTIKILTGAFGTGKDYLMCAAAIDMLEKGKYDKIVWVRNNVEVKNSRPIGHLPGDSLDKLLPFAMPLADHLGGIDQLEQMVDDGQIEIVHLGFLRGRDIRNSIIMCSEGENLTKEHVQLLIGRVGDGSSLWINGDYKQVDGEVFRQNNGLMIAADRLKGHPMFGYVKLQKTERSATAAMADLLD